MKSSSLAATTTALLSFSFTLLALATIPVIANSKSRIENNAVPNCNAYIATKGSSEKPVTDINGNAVNTSMDYYVIPANANGDVGRSGGYGGISLITGRHRNGLMDVILHPNISNHGIKIRFSQAGYSSDNIVMQWSDLNFIFSALPGKPSWSVDNYDKSLTQWFITDGGVEGNPGGHTLLDWFKFESDGGNTYRIIHCPSVCSTCGTLCNHIGLSPDAVCLQHLAVLPNNLPALSVEIVPAAAPSPPCVC
ncbi:Kunitz trypsin inhibitor 5 [Citrus sinensis]|uniref:Kunitz trypsin inhibitor 5 n=1 Tax=Citrus sinensis TaxID=2711 RepID=A0ACB8JBV4_CITSI|nr:Kunitz trypsin inhibitor 5 [Citrus sinensis]